MVRPLKAGNYLKVGNWSVFVLFGWRFVFGIIMRWEGRRIKAIYCPLQIKAVCSRSAYLGLSQGA